MERQEKIVFQQPLEWGGVVETMFADVLGDGVYRLDNVPLFIPFISIGDTFIARNIVADDPRPYFDKLLERSENVTHRILIADTAKDASAVKTAVERLRTLTETSASYQGTIYSFSISERVSEAQKHELNAKFIDGEDKGLWEWIISSAPHFPLTDVEKYIAENHVTW